MERNGFSLLELIVVMVICMTLIVIGTLSFRGWNDKSKIESQFKSMYADLMGVRTQALYRKKGRSVRITAAGYSIYSSNNVAAAPIKQTALNVRVTTNPANLRIDFDPTGIATLNSDTSISDSYVCTETNASKAVINSIIVSQTRIQIGSLSGSGCNGANVRPQ